MYKGGTTLLWRPVVVGSLRRSSMYDAESQQMMVLTYEIASYSCGDKFLEVGTTHRSYCLLLSFRAQKGPSVWKHVTEL